MSFPAFSPNSRSFSPAPLFQPPSRPACSPKGLMVCAHVGNVSREGQPGGLCMVQTAVLGQGVAEEKSQAAWKGSELAKRFCGVFCMPLPFVFSGHILLPFPEPRGRIGLSLWGRRGLSKGLVPGLSQFLPSPQRAPPGDPVVGGQVIGVQGAAWANK